ncbi:CHAT domain-containing protein [Streptomyces sp. NPDC047082]|uniref:CHAT domain-containing protein n=1 Tax=Streptomyces sp. NPDC047082 TaxID=3155259 RepID=UPI0033EDCF32
MPHHRRDALRLDIVAEDVIRQLHLRFNQNLERIRHRWSSAEVLDYRQAGDGLIQLAASGRQFLWKVFRDPLASYEKLQERLRAWCPTWRTGAPVPVFQVIADSAAYFPWEVLPLFDVYWKGSVQDAASLFDACRVFPAFSAVVERQSPTQVVPDQTLDVSSGALPVRFIWHNEYKGAWRELNFLKGRSDVRLEGPYPDEEGSASSSAPPLWDQLADPWLGVDGRRLEHPDQVLHLSCHAVAQDASGSTTFELHLQGGDGKTLVVSHDDLDAELPISDHRARTAHGRRPSRPMVLLNACETAIYDPKTLGSLLAPFDKNYNRAIIATAARLPDRLAARFSAHFYRALLSGASVGESLYRAKWRLVEKEANPLGLLYILHGSSRLQAAPTTGPWTPVSGSSSPAH